MASGTLGQASLTATTNTTLYTVPVGKVATFNINVCNTNASPVLIRLGICASSSPAAGEYIEYEAAIPAYGVLERSGIVATAGKLVVAYSNTANVNFNVYGYED
jgi:hypothetical protein